MNSRSKCPTQRGKEAPDSPVCPQ
uniref:Uncharacterized protein n=1 Tax=Anguilla anguilla TaxID=7936 RepID=A0A0E9TGR4_ANGAN